jgi:hypothetical protein
MDTADEAPDECQVNLRDWRLHASFLIRRQERDLGNVMEVALRGAIAHARKCAPSGRVDEAEIPAAIRTAFAELGLDPEVRPPASEQLIEAVLRDPQMAEGCLSWQFLSILTLKSQAPWTILRGDTIAPPLVFRLGVEKESLPLESGFLACDGLPILADTTGPLASPWTLPDREQIADCDAPVFICCLPRTLFRRVEPKAHMGRAMWTTWAYSFLRQRTYR